MSITLCLCLARQAAAALRAALWEIGFGGSLEVEQSAISCEGRRANAVPHCRQEGGRGEGRGFRMASPGPVGGQGSGEGTAHGHLSRTGTAALTLPSVDVARLSYLGKSGAKDIFFINLPQNDRKNKADRDHP